jgi:hypothetical protein
LLSAAKVALNRAAQSTPTFDAYPMVHLNHIADESSDFVEIVEQALNNAIDRSYVLEEQTSNPYVS